MKFFPKIFFMPRASKKDGHGPVQFDRTDNLVFELFG